MPDQSPGFGDDIVKSDGLLDVEGVALKDLLESQENALAAAVRRVIGDTADSDSKYAAFSNAP